MSEKIMVLLSGGPHAERTAATAQTRGVLHALLHIADPADSQGGIKAARCVAFAATIGVGLQLVKPAWTASNGTARLNKLIGQGRACAQLAGCSAIWIGEIPQGASLRWPNRALGEEPFVDIDVGPDHLLAWDFYSHTMDGKMVMDADASSTAKP